MELMKTKIEKDAKEAKVKEKAALIALLQERLVESIDMMMQAKQAHWNSKGKNFIALHLLFDEVAEEMEKNVDLIAERIVQLGGTADGTVQTVGKKTKLPLYPLHIVSEQEHVANLSAALLHYRDMERQTIEAAEESGDYGTADMLIQISRGADKYYWMLSAHVYPGH
jgi:starvation-inducible DNA-binding protein